MKKTNLILYLVLVSFGTFFFSSCKKEKITTHENLIIDGNVAPNYEGVSLTEIEIYVSKLYIDLLGIQATQAEINTHTTFLKTNDLRMGARDTLIDLILTKDEYYDRLYNNAKGKYLEGITEYQLNQEIALQNYLVTTYYTVGDTFTAQYLEVLRNKLIILTKIDSLYKNGYITFNQFYATFSDNLVYDNINMGSLNFVQSCFENYLLRQATSSETTNGVKIVDGQSQVILLKNGNSKTDFIRIVTESDEFYEGLVIDNYRAFISRNPTTYESYQATFEFKNSNNLAQMQKSILKTDEYAGF